MVVSPLRTDTPPRGTAVVDCLSPMTLQPPDATKGINKKKNWRGWLERLVTAGGDEEEEEGAGGPSPEGALLKAVRLLGSRLLGLSDPPKAPIG